MTDYDASGFADVEMPVKMWKKGRLKGSGLTAIGPPKAKKKKTSSSNLVPFTKLTPEEKDRLLMECFVGPFKCKTSAQVCVDSES